jgi:hypothetical protein
MIEKTVRYTCDVCKKQYVLKSDDKVPLFDLVLPADRCDEYGSYEDITTVSVAVCKECLKDIDKVLTEHYSIKNIRYGGLIIKRKGGAE